MWRWDQGRLLYFQFDILRSIASVLVKFDNIYIPDCEAAFRNVLETETGMPFSPEAYTVLRNYKRVFECAFLATVVNRRLIVTDFCRELADPNGSMLNVDDYLSTYISRFRFPFPAFDGYNELEQRIYPFCAIIKYLLALRESGREAVLDLESVFELIIANNCTGMEDIAHYKQLTRKACHYTDAQHRQAREMIIFISQFSFLKFYNGRLYLDILSDNAADELLHKFLVPQACPAMVERAQEFLSMTELAGGVVIPRFEVFASDIMDAEFIEGKRKRVEHFRVERSALLRRYFIEKNPRPVCTMCGMDTASKYPWTNYMLDIHHLLPLSSAVALTGKGTSLDDIVGLCPSCHRGIHVYYRKWLKNRRQDDFLSRQEAHDVFLLAVGETVQ